MKHSKVMDQGAVCSIWMSYGLMLVLLNICTISVMVAPESASNYRPLVRPPTENRSSNGNESFISDEDIQNRIREVFNRKGYSNPDPSPNDSLEAQPDTVSVKIESKPTRRRKRPLWKIDETFDPNKSYVIKHPNGTITYVPPRDIDLSAFVATGTATTLNSTLSNETINKMSEASVPMSAKPESTSENPIFSNITVYPHEFINRIMDQQMGRYNEVFGDDFVENDDKLGQRIDVDEQGNAFDYICESKLELRHPQYGQNIRNETVMIVNTDSYMQGVRVEYCQNTTHPCEKLSGLHKKMGCKQFYHHRTLLAINPMTKEPYQEKILLPSCCKCVILK